jgi:hypothetical protein
VRWARRGVHAPTRPDGQTRSDKGGGNLSAIVGAVAQQCECVVYAKRPFAGPEQVLAYMSRYTPMRIEELYRRIPVWPGLLTA